MHDCGWKAEVLTPSSLNQAREYENLRRAQSPDGRYAVRYLRNSEYAVDKGWSPNTVWYFRAIAFFVTAAIVGISAAKLMV